MPSSTDMRNEIEVLNKKLETITMLQDKVQRNIGIANQSHDTDHELLYTTVNVLLLEHISMIESIKRSIQKFIDNGMSSPSMSMRS
jgi:archaellum component FlaC